METKIITDAKALLAALKSGQVDFADGLSYLDTENLVKAGGFSDIRLTGAETQLYVGANVAAKPLDDVRVRQGHRVRPGPRPGGDRGAARGSAIR